VRQKKSNDWRKYVTVDSQTPFSTKKKTHGVTQSTSRASRYPDGFEQTQIYQGLSVGIGQSDSQKSDNPYGRLKQVSSEGC
jgi:hypothetical protein